MIEQELDQYLRRYNPLEEFLEQFSEVRDLNETDAKSITEYIKNTIELNDGDEEIFEYSNALSNQVYDYNGEFYIKKHTRFAPIPYHKHNFIEMIYVYEGECRQLIEDEGHDIILKKNEICFLNPNVTHAISKANKEDIIINCILPINFCDSAFLKLITDNDQLSQFFSYSFMGRKDYYSYVVFHTSENQMIRNIMVNILLEYYNQKLSYRAAIKGYFITLFIELMRAHEASQSISNLTVIDHKVTSILKYIQMNLEQVTLQSVAKQFHLNESYLSRLIRDKTNFSFSEIVLHLKLERACILLKSTPMSVQEISLKIGYENPNYFYKAFKSKYGITPAQYRMECKSEGHQNINNKAQNMW